MEIDLGVGGLAGAGERTPTGRSLPDPFGAAPPSPATIERAVSLVERRAYDSPDTVSALVGVAEVECGWWLLSELVAAADPVSDPARTVTTPDRRDDGADTGPELESPLVQSLAAFTRRPPEEVFRTLHTRLLPELLVTDVVEHVGSAAVAPNYGTSVEIRADDDREFVSAVLFLVAAEAELVHGTRGFSTAARTAVARFSKLVWRLQESSRRATDPSVGPGTVSSP